MLLCLASQRCARNIYISRSALSWNKTWTFPAGSRRLLSAATASTERKGTIVSELVFQPHEGQDIRLYTQWIVPHERRQVAGDQKYIVLLHSALGCLSIWKDFPVQLAERAGIPVLAFDRQGHGKSSAVSMDAKYPIHYPRTVRYLTEHALLELPAVISAAEKAIGVTGPPIVYGHSDGGTIALLYASEYPCAAVIAEAPHVFVEEQLMHPAMEEAKRSFWSEGSKFRNSLEKHHGANTEGVFTAWANTWTSPEYRDWNVESCLSKIKCPTLVIQGDADEYATLRQVDSIVEQVGGPSEKLVLPGIEHHPHHEARQSVLQGAADFLSRWV